MRWRSGLPVLLLSSAKGTSNFDGRRARSGARRRVCRISASFASMPGLSASTGGAAIGRPPIRSHRPDVAHQRLVADLLDAQGADPWGTIGQLRARQGPILKAHRDNGRPHTVYPDGAPGGVSNNFAMGA